MKNASFSDSFIIYRQSPIFLLDHLTKLPTQRVLFVIVCLAQWSFFWLFGTIIVKTRLQFSYDRSPPPPSPQPVKCDGLYFATVHYRCLIILLKFCILTRMGFLSNETYRCLHIFRIFEWSSSTS